MKNAIVLRRAQTTLINSLLIPLKDKCTSSIECQLSQGNGMTLTTLSNDQLLFLKYDSSNYLYGIIITLPEFDRFLREFVLSDERNSSLVWMIAIFDIVAKVH